MPATQSVITDRQIEQFDREGAVNITGPLDAAQVAVLGELFDQLMPAPPMAQRKPYERQVLANDFLQQPVVDLIGHPFFESIAQRVLRTGHVVFHSIFLNQAYATPQHAFDHWQHVDIKYRLDDLDGTPRRMLCSFMVWLTDVTLDRAPFMYRPGSHRAIARRMQSDPQYTDNPVRLEDLGDLPLADVQPLLVSAGDVTVNTSALVHGASVNTGEHDRKVIFLHYHPADYEVRANMAINEQRNAYRRRLRERLPDDRRRLVADA